MENWQPHLLSEDKLVMKEYNVGGTVTTTINHHFDNEYDGDIEVRQSLPLYEGGKDQYMILTRNELYNILFHFMSTKELEKIAELKSNKAMNELADETGWEGFRRP